MMKPEMIQKIDAILDRVKDPESDLSVAELGLVKKVRYSEDHDLLYVFTDFQSRSPNCVSCAGIAMALSATILKNLEAEFRKEFPDLAIEFV
jgi:metal-sulfur cluster biosynthetic enzyme